MSPPINIPMGTFVASDNTVGCYVQEERRRYAATSARVCLHALLQKPPHGLSDIVLAVPGEVLVQEPAVRGQLRTCCAM